jgi:uncharacterized membrane protein YhaH (DUF805 family)
MDTILAVLFDFSGRIRRSTWLVFAILLFAAESLAGLLLRELISSPLSAAGHDDFQAVFEDQAALCGSLIFLWPSLAVDVKRWHDMGKSGWNTLIVYGPILAIFALELAGIGSTIAVPEPFSTALLDAFALTALIYFIILAARKGTAGINRYGPAR